MKKTELTKEEIIHLAKLAGLNLTAEEIVKYQQQFSETLDYINNLNELNTESVKPTSQTVDLSNVCFEDGEQNKRQLSINEVLTNTSSKTADNFKVNRIQ